MNTLIYIIYILGFLAYTFLCVKGYSNEAILLILPLILSAIIIKDELK